MSNNAPTRADMAGMPAEALEEAARLQQQLRDYCGGHPTINDVVPYAFCLIADLRTRLDRVERELRRLQEPQR